MTFASVSLAPLLELARPHFRGAPELTAEPMPGGMSSRSFYRVRAVEPRPTAPLASAVGMHHPDPARSDEATATAAPGARFPFVEVQQLLARSGVRVPRLLGADASRGWLLVEDLGDQTLAEALRRSPEQRAALYQRAIADLARAQAALEPLPSDHLVAQRAFSREVLHWELEHFREYGLQANGVCLSPSQAGVFERAARYLCEQIASLRYGFVHRDYQSRNLMVLYAGAHQLELVWIDFQDALRGPRSYDLVALLHDSYQDLDERFIDARLDEYCELRQIADRAALRREFDLITVQRKLKDAGRFVYFDVKTGDSSYRRFVQPSIGKVQRALERLEGPELRQLARLLDGCFARPDPAQSSKSGIRLP